ncbi:MAG TPA: Gfo/Idh/MocA family oxidoreductase [Candidatus Limnocylindrales bacterium]|nr:Gfo/Idh/MocA family oxidoreductase [Candidatus Limnocylindrales bacterium]
MLRVAIIGCGKIADQHADHIVHTPNCEIVAVCDAEELMAKQLKERLNVPAHYSNVQDLLHDAKPDVVHITTPPQIHHSIGKQCLEAGCHVYIEKPFTVHHKDAEDLISLAKRANVKLTVGHDAQFKPAAIRMRHLVNQGYLGGPPVHLEAYFCYDLSDASYAKALLGDPQHWVRKLPGGLLHNTISHGIAKLAEFLAGYDLNIVTYGFTSRTLKSIGETEIVDELRVIIHDGATTAYFTFSSQMRPSLSMLRLYGPKNGLIVDERQQTVIKLRGAAYKSYLEHFLPPWGFAGQYIGNVLGNLKKFAKADFHVEYGKKFLIREFYRSIAQDAPPPIPYDQILRTSQIMAVIFDQLNARSQSQFGAQARVAPAAMIAPEMKS